MTNKSKEEELRQEFTNAFRKGEGAWHPNFELMQDWWLSKFASYQLEVEKKIEGLRAREELNHPYFQKYTALGAYELAIDDILSALTDTK